LIQSMFKNIFGLVLIIVSIRCSRAVNSFEGVYASPKKTIFQRGIAGLQNITSPSHDTLELRSDSTCVFRNCSMSAEGYWKYRKDTVLIYYLSKSFNISGLNEDKNYNKFLKCDSVPYKFVVLRRGRLLKCTIGCKDGEIFIADLEKINIVKKSD
jgi:hypothetical protein